jgi:hypothetical protein
MLPQIEKELASAYRGYSELRQHIVKSDISSQRHIELLATSMIPAIK